MGELLKNIISEKTASSLRTIGKEGDLLVIAKKLGMTIEQYLAYLEIQSTGGSLARSIVDKGKSPRVTAQMDANMHGN